MLIESWSQNYYQLLNVAINYRKGIVIKLDIKMSVFSRRYSKHKHKFRIMIKATGNLLKCTFFAIATDVKSGREINF
jgi:hypothetical protein